jgi:hypothetical protein
LTRRAGATVDRFSAAVAVHAAGQTERQACDRHARSAVGPGDARAALAVSAPPAELAARAGTAVEDAAAAVAVLATRKAEIGALFGDAADGPDISEEHLTVEVSARSVLTANRGVDRAAGVENAGGIGASAREDRATAQARDDEQRNPID